MLDTDNLSRDDLLSAECIELIFEVEDPVQRELLIQRLETMARGYGVKQQFTNLLKAQKKKIDAKRQELTQRTEPEDNYGNVAALDWESGQFLQPATGKWIVTERGVCCMGRDNGMLYACNYPIIMTARYADRETGREEVQVSWKKENIFRNLRIPRSTIASNTKIVALSDYGLPVTSEMARALVSYLSDYERYNPSIIPLYSSTSKFGWIDDLFMPYDAGDRLELNVHPGFKTLAASIKTSGDEAAWYSVIKTIRASGRVEPLIYMAASFGSAMLPKLNLMPFIVNLYGESGKGKTVALMVAASIWADPSSGQFLTESTSTINSIEQRLNILNHLPMMIDDLSKIRDRGDNEKFTELIYMLCAGRGKSRLTKDLGMRETATWDNIILTNIERPLANDTMQGGAINRVLDFEIQDGPIFADGNAVVTAISKTYGHAGAEFVQVLKDHADEIGATVQAYEARIKELAAKTGKPKEQKQVSPLAVLMAADEMTERYIFQDGVRLDIDYCVSQLKDVETVSEMRRAYNALLDEVAVNRDKFDPDDDKRGEVWGYAKDDEIRVIPSALDGIARRHNFNVKQFASWADRHGLLIRGGAKMQKVCKIPTIPHSVRCYVFKRIEEADEPEEYMQEAFATCGEDDIPF